MINLEELNSELEVLPPTDIVRHAFKNLFGDRLVVASSFGADSAVMLHMATQINPRIRVIMIDTGYLFPETHEYVITLKERLKLNLHVFYGKETPEEMERNHGQLWEYGEEGLSLYHSIRKVEPLRRAIQQLKVKGILHGVRRDQTEHRSNLNVIERGYDGTFKIHPILKWTSRDIRSYNKTHNLPEHPLFLQGYESIGDIHSTKPGERRSDRDLGESDECGINYQI
ncbi:MAG: phosphoadenylyl-sulfate reductase [Candidatus Paceibacterota bacterium]